MHRLIRIWRQLIVGAGLVLLCALALAAPPSTLRFDQLAMEPGIAAIVQDRQGFMWFGAQGGLNRFDGYRVINYKNIPNDPNSLSTNWVQSLHIDPQDRLWIGTRAGLNLFDPATERFTRYSPNEAASRGNDNVFIKEIADDGRGGLWLATNDGLQHFDPATARFTIKRHDPADSGSLSNNTLRAMGRDAQGNLWISTAIGIDRLAPGANSFQHFRVHASAVPNAKRRVSVELRINSDNTLWFSAPDGLEAWSLSDGEPQRRVLDLPAELKQRGVGVPYRDRDGNLWFGTQDGLKLWDVDAKRVIAYRNQPNDPHSLADDHVVALFQDRIGTLWVGTWTAGVSRVDLASGGFSRLVQTPGKVGNLSSNKITHIFGGKEGRLWLATAGGGLNLLDPTSGEATVYRHDPANSHSLSHDLVTSINYDNAGQLWVGTTEGLNRFDPATGQFTVRPFVAGNSASNSITKILSDHTGKLWVASLGGLHRLDPGTDKLDSYLHDPANPASLASNKITNIYEDPQGVLWLGTADGLDRLDQTTGRFTHFRHDPKDATSLASGVVNFLLRDSKGTLWIATDSGLSQMEIGADGAVRFRVFATSAAVDGILADDEGRLWLSTDVGVSRFDPISAEFKHYTARDGMIEGGHYNGSAFRDGRGVFYFGGPNGLTVFRPEMIRENTQSPPVVITDFQIFNHTVRGGKAPDGFVLKGPIQNAKQVTMSYLHSVFSIEFAALHYSDPERNSFAYQLQGFDKEWIHTDASRRFVTYTNLDPGNYVFRVKAANKSGVWNEVGTALEITITPPFWKTWWFRTLAGIVLASGIWTAYRVRIRALVQQRIVLEKQVGARTSEVERKNIELNHANAELALSSETLRQLSDVGRAITANLDAAAVFHALDSHVHGLLDAAHLSILLLDADGESLQRVFGVEQGKPLPPLRVALSNHTDDAVRCVLQRRELLIDIESINNGPASVSGTLPIRTRLFVPLTMADKMLGVMTIQSVQRYAYSEREKLIFRTLCAYGAIALDNAAAYRQVEATLTRLRETQAHLIQQEKMASLGTLTAGVAHEINNPANFAHVGAQALSDNLERFRTYLLQLAADETDHAVIDSLNRHIDALSSQTDTIIEGTTRIKNLVVDLLTFTRLNVKGKETVPVGGSILSTVNLVRTQYMETTEIRCELDTDPAIECWPALLNQVFMNVIVNACQATQKKHADTVQQGLGLLTIRSRIHEDRWLAIEFEDHGCGIPADVIDHIFEPFYTTKVVGQGTGLGLSISFGIVEKHGGRMSVRSVEGEGACITVMLPLS